MGVSRGYHNKPEKNAEAFVPNPFNPADPSDRLYRTGDVVRMLDTGDLEFLGREDHQINLRGYRIEAGEIESALRDHESVTEAVVVPRKDTAGSLTLVAFYTGSEVPVAALRDHLAKRLPEYMIPAHFELLGEMPCTPSGKLDKNRLPDVVIVHGGQLGILHRGRGSLLQRGEASCARCLRGGLEHFRGRKPAGRGADGPWNYAGIGM